MKTGIIKYLVFLSSLLCGVHALTPAAVTHKASSYEPSRRYLRTSNNAKEIANENEDENNASLFSGVNNFFSGMWNEEGELDVWRWMNSFFEESEDAGADGDASPSSSARAVSSSSKSAAKAKTAKLSPKTSGRNVPRRTINKNGESAEDVDENDEDGLSHLTRKFPTMEDVGLNIDDLNDMVADACNSVSEYCTYLGEKAWSLIDDNGDAGSKKKKQVRKTRT
ncbi:multidrug transporter, putative [Babesia ovis]|uniref:Multidrug transporter, putative n=1 Tax=Babesia ovis TaxID=5869 RepID=A0A9W5WTA4_BABOV|nr:multidrug transporter, putative [Babesia ovis]